MTIILSILPSLGSRHSYLGMCIRMWLNDNSNPSVFSHDIVLVLWDVLVAFRCLLCWSQYHANEIWSELLPGKSEGKRFQAQFWEKDHPISLWTLYWNNGILQGPKPTFVLLWNQEVSNHSISCPEIAQRLGCNYKPITQRLSKTSRNIDFPHTWGSNFLEPCAQHQLNARYHWSAFPIAKQIFNS